ncbi:hypothetical protein [Chitinophaga sp. RAB17]|uniref:hypothetical protein n=1 Tax=Chitinophaga sp. RAB17 TaxID=3233049 RepID=UPI003F92BE0E
MEDTEMIHLWKSYDKKLEENLSFNRQNAADITHMKVQSALASMKPLKIFTILIGIIWVIWVDSILISTFHIANPFFLVSAGIQVLLTKLAIGIYLYQLLLIQQVDINAPVLDTQEKLSKLKSSTLWCARLLFLQLPVWTTFYWNQSMLDNSNGWLYALQIMVTVSFTYLAIWLFVNIRYKNSHKKWFHFIFNGKEWNPVIKAMELLHQVQEYRQ